jgi:lipoyl(octanoyl) transferase
MTLAAPEWHVEPGLTGYADAVATMERQVAAIRDASGPERIWLVEHPPLYTAGTSAQATDLLEPTRLPVFTTGRGGQYTYHGPGQRVGYVMLDLAARGRDVRCFVDSLEHWVIAALKILGIDAFQSHGRVGIWTRTPNGIAKIGAIGVRVRRWVTFHGFALNVAPDLAQFAGIIPCGLPDSPVTSLKALGNSASMAETDAALKTTLPAFLAALH